MIATSEKFKEHCIAMKNTSAQLIMPSSGLTSCVFAFVLRDTRGVSLEDDERINRFPASPLCAISWIFEGDTHLVETQQAMPQLSFSGPQTKPTLSYNPNSVFALTVGIYPEAWKALTGMHISDYIDKTVPLESIIDEEFLDMFLRFFDEQTFSQKLSDFDEALLMEWKKTRPRHALIPQGLQDWLYRILAQAATSNTSKSLRQVQRRFKSLTGQNHREIASYARMEGLFSHWLESRKDSTSSLASLATDTGFSDQSHMGREVKRHIGFSPAKLDKLIDTDESFWFYRLMGERY